MAIAASKRPRRTSINGVRNVLTVSGKDPNFVYRVVNDTGDRVEQMKEIGYEVVSDPNISVGDRRVSNPTKEGSPVRVSVGGGQQAYLMRIRKDWNEEDNAKKAAYVDTIEKGTFREAKQNSDYGKIAVE